MAGITVGTAGHIDHGKTTLVRALTGIDTDRLAEEKARGISIELGFAHLTLAGEPAIRVGFVDVPGHERFVRTMLAGVSGIDIVMLIVAADEGVKPQTEEHFAICKLLGIPRGLVVLTKADRVSSTRIEEVGQQVERLVSGSFLEGAPQVPVSAVTGSGLEELQARLRELALATPQKPEELPFRLPIDRAFTMKGFGAVVTGTILSGRVQVGDEVELHPAGTRVRVRGIQVHSEAVERAAAGQRTAINLAGIERSALARGMTLSAPEIYRPAQNFAAELHWLDSAGPLERTLPVHVHAGTFETVGQVRPWKPDDRPGLGLLAPGQSGFVHLKLREDTLLLPGDRFIIRQFSPLITLGGGTIVEINPFSKRTQAQLRVLASGSMPEKTELLVSETPHGVPAEQLRRLLGREPEKSPGTFYWKDHFVSKEWAIAVLTAMEQSLAKFHLQNPLLTGCSREALRRQFTPSSPAAVFDALLEKAANLVREGDLVRLSTHQVKLQKADDEGRTRMIAAFAAAGLAVPSVPEVLAASGLPTARAKLLLQMLLRERILISIGADLVMHKDAIEGLKQQLAAHKGTSFSVGTFKEWTKVSRKYAIPLLEFLDREKVTRRQGDQRLVL